MSELSISFEITHPEAQSCHSKNFKLIDNPDSRATLSTNTTCKMASKIRSNRETNPRRRNNMNNNSKIVNPFKELRTNLYIILTLVCLIILYLQSVDAGGKGGKGNLSNSIIQDNLS